MKRPTKPKRHEYHVTYDKAAKLWVGKSGGALMIAYRDRATVIGLCALVLARFADTLGQHSELIIHRKDGSIGKGPSSRRSYGGDPKGTKG